MTESNLCPAVYTDPDDGRKWPCTRDKHAGNVHAHHLSPDAVYVFTGSVGGGD